MIPRVRSYACAHLLLSLALASFCIMSAGTSFAQRDDTGSLSADEAIQILQENPELLAEAKTRIAGAAQERGYPVTERDISDDRLFSQIRSDDRALAAVSDELVRRGFGPQREAAPTAAPKPATAEAKPATGEASPPTEANRDRGPRKEKENGRGPSQSQYPYRNLPALRDLYTQSKVDSDNLERFGAALFRNSAALADKTFDAPVGPDYVLGLGDELIVQYWGSAYQRLQLSVDRQGQISLLEAGTLMVAGRTLSETQQAIQKLLDRQYRHVSVDVSLGKLRKVRVYVVGDVKNPGAYETSSVSNVLSAVLAAGGPSETGSLRTVKHYRGKKLVEEIDLYDLMLKGVSATEARFESGDSILVPPVGTQVTIAGMVRRPAIYELRSGETLDQALELAGGVTVAGELQKIKVERIEAHEHKVMFNLNLPPDSGLQAFRESFRSFVMKDGDHVTITPILSYTNQMVYLQGHVFRPGKYPYTEGTKVSDLISSFNDLLPEPADRAEIVRLRAPDNRPYVIGFDLREVLEKRAPPPTLQPFDTIRIFGRYEADAPKVSIYGEVLRPGEYPLSDRMTAVDLLRLAGGFMRSAYTQSADLASYSIVNRDHVELEHREVPIGLAAAGEPDTDVVLKPGDVLTISQLGGWNNIGGAITLTGEVLHPGRYGIQEGERLSSILKRAGGFREGAYPNGAFLERVQVKQIAAENRDELVQKLQSQALVTGGKIEPVSVTRQRQQLIDRIKQIRPIGRQFIHISAQIEKWENTSADIEVRAGDTLIIPKTPNFVLVGGQVYAPAAVTFTPGKNAGWYLRQAGGVTTSGNQKEVFVVRADGSVVGKDSGGWWSGSVLSTLLRPGDTVYVPEKFQGSDRLKTYAQMAQIMSGVAVAASIAIHF